ncbi:hypothetical protein BGW39_009727 [Mortierella sp. 14UC]|nr:hypothetical protein BGW39_009727 [Mortierella sp. 14UC]
MDAAWAELIQEPSSKEEKTVSLNTALPSPSPELEQAVPWSGMSLAQERPVASKDETTTTRSTGFLPSPSPELSSIRLPWGEKDDKVLNALLDSYIAGTLPENDSSLTPTGYGTTLFSSFGSLSSFSDHTTSLSVSATGLGIPQPSAEHGVEASLYSSGFTTDMSIEQSTASDFAPCMSNEDFILALLTPEPLLEQSEPAMDSTPAELPSTPLCVHPNDLLQTTTVDEMTAEDESDADDDSDAEGETEVEDVMDDDYESDESDDETDVEGAPANYAYVHICPPRDDIAKSKSDPTSFFPSVQKSVRFDMNLHIEELDPDRVMSPPKQPGEERMDIAFRRACREYREDLELLQEHSDAKRAAFNAYLHAAFPVVKNEGQAIETNSTVKRLANKRFLDIGDHSDDEHIAKKTRVAKQPSSHSSTVNITVNNLIPNDQAVNDTQIREPAALEEHPDFELMVENDQPGRVFRVARWGVYYPVLKKSAFKNDSRCRMF